MFVPVCSGPALSTDNRVARTGLTSPSTASMSAAAAAARDGADAAAAPCCCWCCCPCPCCCCCCCSGPCCCCCCFCCPPAQHTSVCSISRWQSESPDFYTNFNTLKKLSSPEAVIEAQKRDTSDWNVCFDEGCPTSCRHFILYLCLSIICAFIYAANNNCTWRHYTPSRGFCSTVYSSHCIEFPKTTKLSRFRISNHAGCASIPYHVWNLFLQTHFRTIQKLLYQTTIFIHVIVRLLSRAIWFVYSQLVMNSVDN